MFLKGFKDSSDSILNILLSLSSNRLSSKQDTYLVWNTHSLPSTSRGKSPVMRQSFRKEGLPRILISILTLKIIIRSSEDFQPFQTHSRKELRLITIALTFRRSSGVIVYFFIRLRRRPRALPVDECKLCS